MSDNSPSRRDFLKTSSAAAVSAGLLSSFTLPGAYAAGSETINIGLIGCGGRGNGAGAQALSTDGRVRLAAVGDVFEEQIDRGLNEIKRAVANKKDAEVDLDKVKKFVGFDAFEKVLDSGVDLVVLATPPGFRPYHFAAAVNAGKHVFMEKPVATDSAGVRMVLAANEIAKQKNLKVGVGLQRHHQACYRDIISKIQDGAIGDIVSMRVYWNDGGVWDPRRTREECRSEMEYQVRNWYYYNWLSGDHICEQHIHNLDVANWIKGGPPAKAIGMGGREVRKDKKYGEIFDHHAVEFTYPDGTKLFSQCRHIRGCWNAVTEHVHGTKGSADLSSNPRDCRITPREGEVYQYRGQNDNPYQVEHDDLFAAIRENRPYNEGDYGAMSTMTSILGRMATYSGKEIAMEAALASQKTIMPAEFGWDKPAPTNPNENGEYPVPVPGVTEVL